MTRTQVQDALMQALTSVAPELASTSLNPDRPLRDQVDIDSMDFLRFVRELHARLGVEVPESDYVKLATLTGAAEYLAARLPTSAG